MGSRRPVARARRQRLYSASLLGRLLDSRFWTSLLLKAIQHGSEAGAPCCWSMGARCRSWEFGDVLPDRAAAMGAPPIPLHSTQIPDAGFLSSQHRTYPDAPYCSNTDFM